MDKAGARHSKADNEMIQSMHDHAVKLGASCGGMNKVADDDSRICKVDSQHGLVFGFAIVCKNAGQEYFDLNIDDDGERVPEYIPEDTMLKAAIDFAKTARPGNEMHKGPDVGTYYFLFPLTTDIAKAFNIQSSRTGLMVAYHPGDPEVLEKFRDGTYKGFSIEGKRVKIEEVEGD